MKIIDPTCHHRHQAQALQGQMEAIQEELHGHAARLTSIQQAILQTTFPAIPGLGPAVWHQPRHVVGGDWYGVVPFGRPRDPAPTIVGIAIGDVCGHDVAATVVMAMVLAILRCYPQSPASPADVMRHLNAHLHEMNLPNGYTTAFLGLLALDTWQLTYCIGGHPRPLVRRPDGTVRPLDGPAGYPIGLFADAECEDAHETLPPGSMLCLYTDGVTDTAAPDGNRYGLKALVDSLATAEDRPQAVVDNIVARVTQYQGPAPQDDDRTLLVARVGAHAND